MATITGANSVFMLSIGGLYPAPVQLQGWSTDDAFAAESVSTVVTQMGIDGRQSAGFVHASRPITVTLQADSASNNVFDNWTMAQEAAAEVYFCAAVIDMPAIGKSAACTNGVMTTTSPFADVKKTLQPRKFTLTFERIIVSPI